MNCNYALSTRAQVMEIIKELDRQKESFLKNPKKDFTRKRKLSFSDMLQTVLSMGGQSIRKELLSRYGFGMNTPTASAFVQQRDKILPGAFEQLFHTFTNSLPCERLYKGFRLLAVDGTAVNISYDENDWETLLERNPGQRGCSQFQIVSMYDLCNKIYTDALAQGIKRRNEHAGMVTLVKRSGKHPKIIIADRGFASYNVLTTLQEYDCNYVIRCQEMNEKGIFSEIMFSEEEEFDKNITRFLTHRNRKFEKSRPDIFKYIANPIDPLDVEEKSYYPLSTRIVRFRLPNGQLQALLTNLPADQFPVGALKEIYQRRWGVETSFRLLKHNLGLPYFHAKKRSFILQEIFAKLAMFNFCSTIIEHTIGPKHGRKHKHNANYAISIFICLAFFRNALSNNSLLERLLLLHSVPERPNRNFKRPASSPRQYLSFDFRFA
jgi:hypothetical protein